MNKLDEFEVIIEYNNLKFSVTGTFNIGKEGEHSSYNDVLGTPPEPPELYVVDICILASDGSMTESVYECLDSKVINEIEDLTWDYLNDC
tara:strand:- start:1877 stop:2146 length:270 start_codon:yes stop_codon:yes gene_type:complete